MCLVKGSLLGLFAAVLGFGHLDAQEPKRTHVVIVSSADAFKDAYLRFSQAFPAYRGNAQFLHNALDVLCGHPGLLEIQQQEPTYVSVRKGGPAARRKIEKEIQAVLETYALEGKKEGSSLSATDRKALSKLAKESADRVLKDAEKRWPAERAKVSLSSGSRAIIAGLREPIRVEYYASTTIPESLQPTRRFVVSVLRKLKALSKNVQVAVIDPGAAAAKHAREMSEEYLATQASGGSPKEPAPAQAIPDLFRRRLPGPETRRANRERKAEQIARAEGRPKEVVYRELLHDDFRRAYLGRLKNMGVAGMTILATSGDSVNQEQIYTSVVVTYRDYPPTSFMVTSPSSFEYRLVKQISVAIRARSPVVAFIGFGPSTESKPPPGGLPRGLPNPIPQPPNPLSPRAPTAPPGTPDHTGLVGFLDPSFDLRQVTLTQGDSLQDLAKKLRNEEKERFGQAGKAGDGFASLAAIVISRPHALSPRQVYEIELAVSKGVHAIFLAAPFSVAPKDPVLPVRALDLGGAFGELLGRWGVALPSRILASNDCAGIEMPRRAQGIPVQVRQPTPLPFVVMPAADALHAPSPFLESVAHLALPTTSGITLKNSVLEKLGVKARVLASSPPASWSVNVDAKAVKGKSIAADYQASLAVKRSESAKDFMKPVPLVVWLRGKFPGPSGTAPGWGE